VVDSPTGNELQNLRISGGLTTAGSASTLTVHSLLQTSHSAAARKPPAELDAVITKQRRWRVFSSRSCCCWHCPAPVRFLVCQ